MFVEITTFLTDMSGPPLHHHILELKKELDLEITKINSWLTFFLKSVEGENTTILNWLCRTTKRFWILEMKWCGTWNFLWWTLNLWVWGPCWLVLLAECHQPIILNNRKEYPHHATNKSSHFNTNTNSCLKLLFSFFCDMIPWYDPLTWSGLLWWSWCPG